MKWLNAVVCLFLVSCASAPTTQPFVPSETISAEQYGTMRPLIAALYVTEGHRLPEAVAATVGNAIVGMDTQWREGRGIPVAGLVDQVIGPLAEVSVGQIPVDREAFIILGAGLLVLRDAIGAQSPVFQKVEQYVASLTIVEIIPDPGKS